jgi:hypothetical protein
VAKHPEAVAQTVAAVRATTAPPATKADFHNFKLTNFLPFSIFRENPCFLGG